MMILNFYYHMKKMQNTTKVKKLAIDKMAPLTKIAIDKKELDISIREI